MSTLGTSAHQRQAELYATPSVEADAFRQALSRLAAGVSIITTMDQAGQLRGLTATAVTSLSLQPPLLLVCLDNRLTTTTALRNGGGFIVHLLAADQQELAQCFARTLPDKFAGVSYTLTDSGYPRLEGVLASVECLVHQHYPGGDHTIIIGRAVEARLGWPGRQPLVYFQHQFRQLHGG